MSLTLEKAQRLNKVLKLGTVHLKTVMEGRVFTSEEGSIMVDEGIFLRVVHFDLETVTLLFSHDSFCSIPHSAAKRYFGPMVWSQLLTDPSQFFREGKKQKASTFKSYEEGGGWS